MKRTYPSAGKEYKRNDHLKRRYGITLDQWNEMFSEQGGCCAICNKHQSELKKNLAVDHNHTTGEIRKLLCSNCNTAIGLLNEDTELLLNAIEYLRSAKS